MSASRKPVTQTTARVAMVVVAVRQCVLVGVRAVTTLHGARRVDSIATRRINTLIRFKYNPLLRLDNYESSI